jgi:hypothetical protein
MSSASIYGRRLTLARAKRASGARIVVIRLDVPQKFFARSFQNVREGIRLWRAQSGTTRNQRLPMRFACQSRQLRQSARFVVDFPTPMCNVNIRQPFHFLPFLGTLVSRDST